MKVLGPPSEKMRDKLSLPPSTLMERVVKSIVPGQPELNEVLARMLQWDPDDRIRAKDAVEIRPFFAGCVLFAHPINKMNAAHEFAFEAMNITPKETMKLLKQEAKLPTHKHHE